MSINPTQSGPTTPVAPMTITPAALQKVRDFAEQNKEFQGKSFRVFVEGGGCSGFRYAFVFDDRGEEDAGWSANGVDVVVDPISLQYLRGATVDFVDDLRGSGFVVNNPNASGSCGCGHSFNV
jgi:iron-sulfur cluster insertion protein